MPTANLSNSSGRMQALSRLEWLWLLPAACAFAYPALLAQAHVASANRAPLWALGFLGGAFAVPVLAMAVLWRIDRTGANSQRLVLARRATLFVVAVPPSYTLLGVLLYLMKIEGLDTQVWSGLWLAIIACNVMAGLTIGNAPPERASDRTSVYLRTAHGVSALVLLVVFVAPHLFNHVTGLWGSDLHRTVMEALRHFYRAGLVEPVLVVAFFFQILSGIVLVRRKTLDAGSPSVHVQTASGAYLAMFLAAHINSVFTLARYFGQETDYAWATGAPAGLIADAWSIRLVPHYALAVLFVLMHLVAASHVVMRAHGFQARRARHTALVLLLLAAIATVAIVAAMLGVRMQGALL